MIEDINSQASKEQNGEKDKTQEPRVPITEKILTGGIWIELDDAQEGELAFRIIDGGIHIDRKRLDKEKIYVKKVLSDSIEQGDEELFIKLTKGLGKAEDEELIDLYIELQKAFKKQQKNPFGLKSINVDLLTDGIAERNLIREALKPRIKQLPFVFTDEDGNKLTDDLLDFIFIKDKGNKYTLVVGSKRGIGGIELPDKLENNQYQPDLLKIDKDGVTNSITIPLKLAKDGSDPLIETIIIRKGSVDLIEIASREEALARAEKTAKKRQQDYESRSTYSPPSPKPPKKAYESGGSGYVSVSR